uniref:Ribosomal protein L6 n=1 Tax=Piridium sociabile TaxID=2570542 RepID=A0A5B9XVN7_9ALVE|nr:ribosomal protein L6 [Piridium sociabile]
MVKYSKIIIINNKVSKNNIIILDRHKGFIKYCIQYKYIKFYQQIVDYVQLNLYKKNHLLLFDYTYKFNHNTFKSLINNILYGISNYFNTCLKLVGVGYKVKYFNNNLRLFVGYTHFIDIKVPTNIIVVIKEDLFIHLSSVNKDLLGDFASILLSKKPPEPYKGKGIQFVNKVYKLKSNKTKH